ncbi:olfactory receptor 52A5-like, partial [Bombina bombina]|uniref:olfactory receptor 52A5-like n=1 Tax=Bombina bombina TaxID=8345 RepID=UPI00235A8D69
MDNFTSFYPSMFILVGIPGLEIVPNWISIMFCSFYIMALFGNLILMLVIPLSSSLHSPMYSFLFLLAANDTLLSTCIVPKMLSIIWFNLKLISFNGCLLQMFFVHCFTSTESGLLLTMAFDRYLAICKPLRYTMIMTNTLIMKMVIILLTRATILMAPSIILIKLFPAFKTNVIAHSYCEHMAVVKLAAADIRVNSVLGLIVAFTILGVDVLLVLLSYSIIFHAVYHIPSKTARLKAFNTCTPHICVFLSFYALAFFSFLSHRYGKSIPSYVHIILSDMYLLVPPMLNPIIYGIKTKRIRDQVKELFNL